MLEVCVAGFYHKRCPFRPSVVLERPSLLPANGDCGKPGHSMYNRHQPLIRALSPLHPVHDSFSSPTLTCLAETNSIQRSSDVLWFAPAMCLSCRERRTCVPKVALIFKGMSEGWQDLGMVYFEKQLCWKIQDQNLEEEYPESTKLYDGGRSQARTDERTFLLTPSMKNQLFHLICCEINQIFTLW